MYRVSQESDGLKTHIVETWIQVMGNTNNIILNY